MNKPSDNILINLWVWGALIIAVLFIYEASEKRGDTVTAEDIKPYLYSIDMMILKRLKLKIVI